MRDCNPTQRATTTGRCSAVLVPDRGRLCLSEDYYRSEQHLRAEGVTHSLRLKRREGEVLWLPLIVRPIDGTPYLDAVSPYGMPGALMAGLSMVPKEGVDWQGTELVSIFVRDRIGGPHCFARGTPRCEVCIVDPSRPIRFRETHARHIRRNLRLGFTTTCSPAREASREEQEGFKAVYRETMVRDRAEERYFFSDAWFAGAFASPACWLLTTRSPEGRIASSALAVRSDGFLHYYLGGTTDAALSLSPAKNTIGTMCELAERLGVSLHLGGGLRPGDALEHFKCGFANTTSWFVTHEIVCDPEVYARLSGQRPASDHFPAYRAPRQSEPEVH